MIMQIFENDFFFWVLLFYHLSRKEKKKKAQNKNKVGIRATFLMMKIHKAKIPKQVHFRLGWDERIFLKNIKQQTNILIEQMSNRNKHQQRPNCRLNISCVNLRYQDPIAD
jgi:hypothetical protein